MQKNHWYFLTLIFFAIAFCSFGLMYRFTYSSTLKDHGNWRKSSATIAGKSEGSISREDLFIMLSKGKIEPPKAGKNNKLKIRSYKLLFTDRNGIPYTETALNDSISETAKAVLKSRYKPGDWLIFHNIIAQCTKTKELRLLPPMVFHQYDTVTVLP